MANTTKTVIAVLIALIISASSAVLVSTVKADAKSYKGSAQSHASAKREYKLPASTAKKNAFAKSYVLSVSAKSNKESDWKFTSDAKNIKVKCSYNAKTQKCDFKFTGTSYGLNRISLKYKNRSNKWTTEKLSLFVDTQKNIMRVK